ncbi:hypothetical protein VA7868_01380 [Vibrio aerogenes CECT 7868]|uniref:Sel1 repeat protein n=1 Tax=Vibrio aerogenes CECT 7868 TaxID=1216006 RepID=A0A1M5XYS1_9VIBR|nr:hypothetical protein [Vibrio aerogenes]SHI04892.1 hypothetical protein VA7868_01380 [Vibrio aerogenes CECT 7868]
MSRIKFRTLFKNIIKWLAIAFVSLVLIVFLVFGYLWLFPDGFTARHNEGPKVLTELLHMAEQSKPFNPDPYIASTYRPENPLYQPVLAIQRHRWDIAEKLLEPLAEKGNADAMFWLAEITYGSPYRSSKAAHLYQKSAELGNPYAALRLDVDNSDCQRFMSGYCKEKWGKLGRKLLKERADKGDVKAGYYLLRDKLLTTEEEHKKLESLVTANAKNHYYRPLADLLKRYLKGYYFDRKEPLSSENKRLVIQLMKLAVNNNYVPLMSEIIFDDDISVTSEYMEKMINKRNELDISVTVCREFYPVGEDKPRINVIKLAGCAIASDQEVNRYHDFNMVKSNLKYNDYPPLSEAELSQAKHIADNIIKNMTPVIYIDEMNSVNL